MEDSSLKQVISEGKYKNYSIQIAEHSEEQGIIFSDTPKIRIVHDGGNFESINICKILKSVKVMIDGKNIDLQELSDEYLDSINTSTFESKVDREYDTTLYYNDGDFSKVSLFPVTLRCILIGLKRN